MSEESSGGRPRTLTGKTVLDGFNQIDKPVATAGLLADVVNAPKRTVLRRLRELEEKGQVERWKVGSRAVVWWPTEQS
ncbi:winged helix-turn-helix transcriptional regulator [Halorubrum rutilum]|jgi:DNA-binding IclR family transcriptional regulator|uniref:Winged helix-turn-helix transcriptional regulator n=1 Tax=Halorubrum rutilum TaxID=1364933 RepID=A0ABD6AIU9_9EURY|nr:winged helix-turn-helix transcriptional regulator [Halorubrum rutilum]